MTEINTCPTAPDEAHCFYYTAEQMKLVPGKATFVERVCCYCGFALRRAATATHHLRKHGPHRPADA